MMPRHNEFEYIESCVAVRGYTPGRRLNAYKIRGYCLLLTVNKFTGAIQNLSLIPISEPTSHPKKSYAGFFIEKKKKKKKKK
ncbi:hypothetical protein, partial [Escherichia coli]|uniref:hypothetical protein n=1 Tax=Escherichia coli TaxID=562 RepID=UPI001BAFDF19